MKGLLRTSAIGLLILMLLGGCAGQKQTLDESGVPVVEEEEEATGEEVSDEAEDAGQSLRDISAEVKPEEELLIELEEDEESTDETVGPDEAFLQQGLDSPLIILGAPTTREQQEQPQAVGEPTALTRGWRVQISAVLSEPIAQHVREAARKVTEEEIHIQWRSNSIYYKVLVGDFTSLAYAEAEKDRMRMAGYYDAYIVAGSVKASGPGETTSGRRPKLDLPASTTQEIIRPLGVGKLPPLDMAVSKPKIFLTEPEEKHEEGSDEEPGITTSWEGDFEVETEPQEADSEAVPVEPQYVDGWRVQIMSVSKQAVAEREAKKARTRLGMPAYVEEIGTSYKVRVGNFTTRAEAAVERNRIETAGYNGAFPVPTRIVVFQ